MRAPMRRTIAGRSLSGRAPSEPVQNVTPLAGLDVAPQRWHARPANVAAAVAVGGQQGVGGGQSELHAFVRRTHLRDGELEPGLLHVVLQRREAALRPRVTDR